MTTFDGVVVARREYIADLGHCSRRRIKVIQRRSEVCFIEWLRL
jgi:hypothetical protein